MVTGLQISIQSEMSKQYVRKDKPRVRTLQHCSLKGKNNWARMERKGESQERERKNVIQGPMKVP